MIDLRSILILLIFVYFSISSSSKANSPYIFADGGASFIASCANDALSNDYSISLSITVNTDNTVDIYLSGNNTIDVDIVKGYIDVIRFSDGSYLSFDLIEISPKQYQMLNFSPALTSGNKYSFFFNEGAFQNSSGISSDQVIRYTVP